MSCERLTLDSSGKIDVDSVPIPIPDSEELLLETRTCAICATDVHIYEGRHPMGGSIVPGHEYVGTVREQGSTPLTDATGERLKEGDDVVVVPTVTCGDCYGCRITPESPASCEQAWAHGFRSADEPPYLHGGMSEYLLAEEETVCIKLPSSVSPDEGVLTEPLAITSLAVDRGSSASNGCHPGQESSSIVVQGAGAIGLLVMLAADFRGFDEIIAVDVCADRLSTAADFGATETVALEKSDSAEQLRSKVVTTLPVNRGPDVVIEATGRPEAIKQASLLPRHAGSVISVGNAVDVGRTEIRPATFVQNELTVEGISGAPASRFENAVSIIADHVDTKQVEQLIEARGGLRDATDLFERQAAGKIYRGLIEPNG